MPNIRSALWRLRQFRLAEASHYERAVEHLERATHGTSAKRATDMGGTGNCPLTDNADDYTREREASIQAKKNADQLWSEVSPRIATLDLGMRSVIELYYNAGMAWIDIPQTIKRSPKACEKMHREALARMERELR